MTKGPLASARRAVLPVLVTSLVWTVAAAGFAAAKGGSSLAAPTGVAAGAVTIAQVNLSWNSVTGATGYQVDRSLTSGGPYSAVGNTAGTKFSDTGLAASATYYYVVQATAQGAISPNSAQVSATTPGAPATPAGLTASAVSASQVNLSWSPAANASGYSVLRAPSSSGPFQQVGGTGTFTGFSDGGLAAATTYYYEVEAVSGGVTSAASSSASATTLGLPATPAGLTAAAASASQIDLRWTAAANATGYSVLRSTASGGPFSAVASTGPAAGYSDNGLNAAVTYYYEVDAVSGSFTSAPSNVASATTGVLPVTPDNLTATATAASEVTLAWAAAGGADGYQVLRGTSAGGPFTQIATTNSTPLYLDGGLAADTTYYYEVVSTSPNGPSSSSQPAHATTLPAGRTSYSYQSATGDYIGQGQSNSYTPGNGTTITLSGTAADVTMNVTTATENWSAEFAAPRGSVLQPGVYQNAERAPFRTGRAPGLSVTGDGRGCNTVYGSFAVNQISADAAGNVTLLDVTFTQYCESSSNPPLNGTALWSASPLTYSYTSDAGDLLAGGGQRSYSGSTSTFTLSGTAASATYSVSGQRDSWRVQLSAPAGQQLQVGTYTGAQRFAATGVPGLDVAFNSTECNTYSGDFTIQAIQVDPSGNVIFLSATFDAYCDGATAGTHGTIDYYS